MVDGSPPRLARKVGKSPALVVRRPLFFETARLVLFPDHLEDRRQTPPGPENARWSVNATRLAVPTNEGRRTTIADELRTLRAYPGGDPSTNRPTRPPNSRDGAVCDAASRTKTSRSGQPFALLTQFFLDVQIGSNRWDSRTFVQIDAIQIDMQSRMLHTMQFWEVLKSVQVLEP